MHTYVNKSICMSIISNTNKNVIITYICIGTTRWSGLLNGGRVRARLPSIVREHFPVLPGRPPGLPEGGGAVPLLREEVEGYHAGLHLLMRVCTEYDVYMCIVRFVELRAFCKCMYVCMYVCMYLSNVLYLLHVLPTIPFRSRKPSSICMYVCMTYVTIPYMNVLPYICSR